MNFVYTYEFTIQVVGHGGDIDEAWESVLDSEYISGLEPRDLKPVVIEAMPETFVPPSGRTPSRQPEQSALQNEEVK
jgi:hypothetical protein